MSLPAPALLRPAGHAPRRHPLRGEIVDLGWMRAHRAEWEALAAEAVSPNPFYAPPILEAQVRHGLVAAPRFAVARRGARLTALLPIADAATRFGWRGHVRDAVHSPYMVSATPLVSADDLDANVDALIEALAQSRALWRLRSLTLDDPVGKAVLRRANARRLNLQIVSGYARAVLDRRASQAAFETELSAGRRKDLRRRRRRLEELGAVSLRADAQGAGLGEAMEDFLALEASGWKGARGTALASRPGTAGYARALAAVASPSTVVRVDRLLLDGRAIAASIALICGGTAYLYKTAYDESFSRFAPGVLLEAEIVRALHESGFAARLNSASQAGSLLDTIFPDREAVGDLLIGTDPDVSLEAIDTLVEREATRQRLLRRAKDAYWSLRGR